MALRSVPTSRPGQTLELVHKKLLAVLRLSIIGADLEETSWSQSVDDMQSDDAMLMGGLEYLLDDAGRSHKFKT